MTYYHNKRNKSRAFVAVFSLFYNLFSETTTSPPPNITQIQVCRGFFDSAVFWPPCLKGRFPHSVGEMSRSDKGGRPQ